MKKIGVLSILILCLVIGGVYATWDYAQGSVDNQTSNIAVNLTGSTTNGTKGNIGAQGASTLHIYIDDTTGDHKADTVTGAGELNITFEPSSGADEAVQNSGIKLEYILSVNYNLSEYTYGGVQVFTAVDSTPQALAGGNPTKAVTIRGEDIAALVTVNPELSLPNKAAYEEFYATLSSHGFVLTIREKV